MLVGPQRMHGLHEEDKYTVFEKELYKFESMYKFNQKTCAVLYTVIM
jgi:hypothetical protein